MFCALWVHSWASSNNDSSRPNGSCGLRVPANVPRIRSSLPLESTPIGMPNVSERMRRYAHSSSPPQRVGCRSGPEVAEAEGDRIERANAHRVVVLGARNQKPLPVVELERLERAVRRVHEPQMPDAFAGIDRPLVTADGALVRRVRNAPWENLVEFLGGRPQAWPSTPRAEASARIRSSRSSSTSRAWRSTSGFGYTLTTLPSGATRTGTRRAFSWSTKAWDRLETKPHSVAGRPKFTSLPSGLRAGASGTLEFQSTNGGDE